MATAKKARKSSTRAKGSSEMKIAGLELDKSSSAWDACVSNLLKMNFLSSPSACVKLVDHIHQAGDLGTFLSFSLVVWICRRLRRHNGLVSRVFASNHGYLEGFG
ncbi:hypothetical protein L3X38_023108 [Prunus dulcis]|uniref:Uncharacterized protein n=1 Tax=Prunus dulcis TaxID=3755 RepID=A0AAD4Z584_PRUDU|nr:hypothetical protein L3X38_023108 [Prunus dulcis]